MPFRSPFLAQVAEIEDHAQRGAEELPKLVAGHAFSTDFRQVYATVLERWLGRPSAAIVGGVYSPLAALA